MDNKEYIRHYILPNGKPTMKYKKQAIASCQRKIIIAFYMITVSCHLFCLTPKFTLSAIK